MKISFTKNPESDFFSVKNPNLTKKKILVGGREWGGGVARVSDSFSKESKSDKKSVFF